MDCVLEENAVIAAVLLMRTGQGLGGRHIGSWRTGKGMDQVGRKKISWNVLS
jgi:hypothetical protein